MRECETDESKMTTTDEEEVEWDEEMESNETRLESMTSGAGNN
jgi:hypothetical protein